MNARTARRSPARPAASSCALDAPDGAPRGVAFICHPHPLYGGTMDNKVVQRWRARSCARLARVRFNFRGVGALAGAWDEGRGEVDDALAVIAALQRMPGLPFALAGFSFGGFVAAQRRAQLRRGRKPRAPGARRPVDRRSRRCPRCRPHRWSSTANTTKRCRSATLDWARPRRCRWWCCPVPITFSMGSCAC